jgi:hypothetical protein
VPEDADNRNIDLEDIGGVLRTATRARMRNAITTKRVGPAQCERYNPHIRMT